MTVEAGDSRPEFEDFLEAFVRDLASGTGRDCDEYRAAFPEAAAEIGQCFQDLTSPDLRFGHYQAFRLLGQGGQAVVYLALDTKLRRRVALKVLHRGAATKSVVSRFRREAEITARLNHPSICPVFETGETRGQHWIAMRHVEGDSLAKKISTAKEDVESGSTSTFVVLGERAGREECHSPRSTDERIGPKTSTEIARVLTLFEEAARALHVAHEAGVIHRDIKPGNMIVTQDGEPVILDFGLAQDVQGDHSELTMPGDIMGTPAYMSPEQIAAQRITLDRRTDVYSLGVSLFECLTLRRPFDAPTREALYQAILTKEPPDPRRLNRAIPKDLTAIIETALQKDRDRRYQTAAAMAEDIKAFLLGKPIAARRTGPVGRLRRWSRREPAKASLLLVVMLAVPTITALAGYLIAVMPDRRMAQAATEKARVEVLLQQGYLELGEGRIDPALASFEHAESNGSVTEAAAGKVLAHLHRDDFDAALRLLDAQIARDDKSVWRRLRAETLRRSGKLVGANVNAGASAAGSELDHFLDGMVELWRGDRGDERAYERAKAHLSQAVITAENARALYHFELAHVLGLRPDEKLARSVSEALRIRWNASPFAHYWAGFALEKVAPVEAIACYRRALERATPETSVAISSLSRIARVLQNQGEHRKAIETYEEVLQLVPEHAGAYVDLAIASRESGDLAGAISTLHRGIERFPSDGHLRDSLGQALWANKRKREATAEFQQAVRLNPKLDFAWAAAAFGLTFEGKRREAVVEAERGVEANPESGLAYSGLAAAYVIAGDPSAAAKAARRLFEVAPSMTHDFPSPHENLRDSGVPLVLLEDKLRGLVEADPDFGAGHVFLGIAYRASDNLTKAIEEFELGVELDPQLEWGHYNLGLAEIEAHNAKAAIQALRRAVRIDDRYAWSWFHLGRALCEAGDPLGAIEAFRRAVDLDPSLVDPRYALGAALWNSGDLAGARDCYLTLTQRRPRDATAWEALAEFLTGPKADGHVEPTLGMEAARKAIELRREAETLDTHAWALFRNGRSSEAISAGEEALSVASASERLRIRRDLSHFRDAASRPDSSPSSRR